MSSQKKLWTGNEYAQTGGQTDRRKERQTDGQSDYYIPPEFRSWGGGIIMFITLQPFDLTNLIEQLPAPFMIMGDFNAQNLLWDSDKITDKGRKIEDVTSHVNFCILNDGSNTYLHPGHGFYSSIDLTIVDPSLLIDFNWFVHDDLCGSDHFSISVNTNDRFENYSKNGIVEKPTELNSRISVLRL